jgi:hypothetical protein
VRSSLLTFLHQSARKAGVPLGLFFLMARRIRHRWSAESSGASLPGDDGYADWTAAVECGARGFDAGGLIERADCLENRIGLIE